MVYRQREVLVNFRPSLLNISCLLGAACLYGTANLFLAFAWQRLMIWGGEPSPRWTKSLHVYARSALAKYIPGNVFQFVSRQVLGRAEGWSHQALSLSAIMELALLVLAALMMAVIAFVGFDLDLPLKFSLSVALLSVVGGCIGIAALPMLLHRINPRLFSRSFFSLSKWLLLLKVLPLYVAFFVCGGLALYIVVVQIVPLDIVRSGSSALLLFSIAWVAGVITPGAPSGIGVREAVFVAALTSFSSPAESLLIAILMRVVTIAGDVAFFVSFGLRQPNASFQNRNSSIG